MNKSDWPLKDRELEDLTDFLQNYVDPITNTKIYMIELQAIAEGQSTTLNISLDDLIRYFPNHTLPELVMRNALRYKGLFALASDRIMPDVGETRQAGSVFDLYTQLRKDALNRLIERGITDYRDKIPLELLQKHVVHIYPPLAMPPMPLRRVNADHIGSLVKVSGIVVRASDVVPKVVVQTYVCQTCSHEAYQTVDEVSYTPLSQCPSEECKNNNFKGELQLQLRGSKLVPSQTITLQEQQHEVPVGGVARTLKLVVQSEDLVRKAHPGAHITVSGIYLPEQFSGFRAIKAGLITDQYLLADAIEISKANYDIMEIDDEELEIIDRLSQQSDVYERLSLSISPEIYGHVDTKKALLLSLIGGVTNVRPDGMKIRGDINVMLVGDPGMAKSQLLKFIHKLAPRSVYTTGKGSTGVGLTAAVVRDPKTGDISLEGGALVLADNGVCCIDEFDKMNEDDRTAIHEVMEQQTVSISKAGITTTLNARTTVLAAANPAFGRYNKRRSLSQNMNMPPALLSRFDLVFVLLDIPDYDMDHLLAKHITSVHRHGKGPDRSELNTDVIPPHVIRAYIAKAKQYQPTITETTLRSIAEHYVNLREVTSREDDAASMTSSGSGGSFGTYNNPRERFCTARSLLGIIRLCQALARLHFRETILPQDVSEAIRLLNASKQALDDSQDYVVEDTNVYIYGLINPILSNGPAKLSRLRDLVTLRGYTETQFDDCIDYYTNCNVLSVSRDRETVLML